MIEVCKVVSSIGRPVKQVDYSTKLCPVWSHDGTNSGNISYSRQLVIDYTTQNIFVADYSSELIQVFNSVGNHLYEISAPPNPIGISTNNKLLLDGKV